MVEKVVFFCFFLFFCFFWTFFFWFWRGFCFGFVMMVRGNEESGLSSNGVKDGARKRKRVVEEGMGGEEKGKRLTSRQLALKQKEETKEPSGALYPPTAGFSFFFLFFFFFFLSILLLSFFFPFPSLTPLSSKTIIR